jgi:hypothetical protein
VSEVDRSLDQTIADVGKGSERADRQGSILVRAWYWLETDDASTPCRSATSFPVRAPSRLMNLNSDFDRGGCSLPAMPRGLPPQRRASSGGCSAGQAVQTVWRAGQQRVDHGLGRLRESARAAPAGCAGRLISTGGAAAILAEFAIIGTDRAGLDPA